MDRRRFLEVSTLAVLAVPAKEAIAMHSVLPVNPAPAMIVTPEDAHVYNLLGGGKLACSPPRKQQKVRGGWATSAKIPDS